jgi:PAS domain S-box-containing protein
MGCLLTCVDVSKPLAGHAGAGPAAGWAEDPEALDRLSRLAARLLRAPIALISILTPDHNRFVGAHGLPQPLASSRQLPLSSSICRHVVAANGPLVVRDARSHPLVQDSPVVHELNVIAYLGVPLLGPDGEILGSVCAIDSTPRDWTEDDIETLSVLSRAATSELGAKLYREERKRSEDARRAGEVRTTEILESIGEAFYAIDRDWRFLYVNRHAEQLWGRGRDELLGQSLLDSFPSFVGSPAQRAHERAIAESRPVRFETVSAIFGKPIEINIFPSPSGLSVYFRDISERTQMEQALRERDEALSLAERSAGIGVWDVDLATGTVKGTPQFFRLFGLEPCDEPVPIERLRAVRDPDDQEQVVRGFRHALESGTDYYEMEYRIFRPDGELRWIFGRGRVVRDAGGAPIRYSGIDIDITDRKRLEEQQKLLVEELNHRVKNTITMIQSIAKQSLTEGRPLDDARDAFLRRLHALAHTHTLLTESEWRGVRLSALIENELRPHGRQVSFEGDDVVFSPKAALMLGLVLHELTTNAAKHGALCAAEGRIEVAWRVVDGARLSLAWRERGGPEVNPRSRRGFGSRLLEEAVSYELQGRASLVLAPEGACYEVDAPLAELIDPTVTLERGGASPRPEGRARTREGARE